MSEKIDWLRISEALAPTSSVGGVSRWIKWLIRTLAFFIKEVNEVRRQPRLFVSLVGGPFLVLLVFGLTFQNARPNVRTVLVVPPDGVAGLNDSQLKRIVGPNFNLVDITSDKQEAVARLERGDIDLIQIIPANIQQRVARNETTAMEFLSNTIDPNEEAWIQYLSYAEVNEFNKGLLRHQTAGAQQQAVQLKTQLTAARDTVAQLNTMSDPKQLARARKTIQLLQDLLLQLETNLPPTETLYEQQKAQMDLLRTTIRHLQSDLNTLQASIDSNTIRQQLKTIGNTVTELDQLEKFLQGFISVSPGNLVSPVQSRYINTRGQAYATMIFHAPSVLALLIQHVSITLGALALVRERLMGTFEIFRITPLNSLQLLIGKYLGHTLFVGITALALTVLMRAIGVPILGSLPAFVGLVLLMIVASLGIGFFISLISNSDSQAVQLTMLFLLLSVFFSGIFISLDSFAPIGQAIGLVLPMTYGVTGFKDIMLRGNLPDVWTWAGLGVIALVSFGAVAFLTRQAFRRA